MKITIEVHHIISFDPAAVVLLNTIFPNQAAIDLLEKDITDKTTNLQAVVDNNTQ